MRKSQKYIGAIAGIILSYTAIPANPTQAATITYDINIDFEAGNLAGNSYQGFYSYDPALIIRSNDGKPLVVNDFDYSLGGFQDILNSTIQAENLIVNRLEVFFYDTNENQPGLLIEAFDNPSSSNIYFYLSSFEPSVSLVGKNILGVGNSGVGNGFISLGEVTQQRRFVSIPESSNIVGLVVVGSIGLLLKRRLTASQRAKVRSLIR